MSVPTFQLVVISAAGTAWDGRAQAVVLPGLNGLFGILARHAPLIAALRQGLAKITVDDQEKYLMVGDGYVEVANNVVSVIVGEAAAVKDRATGLRLLAEEHPWDAAAALAADQ